LTILAPELLAIVDLLLADTGIFAVRLFAQIKVQVSKLHQVSGCRRSLPYAICVCLKEGIVCCESRHSHGRSHSHTLSAPFGILAAGSTTCATEFEGITHQINEQNNIARCTTRLRLVNLCKRDLPQNSTCFDGSNNRFALNPNPISDQALNRTALRAVASVVQSQLAV